MTPAEKYEKASQSIVVFGESLEKMRAEMKRLNEVMLELIQVVQSLKAD